jgi:uncharacterized protein with von Willebrand factor type A (vWA) domain
MYTVPKESIIMTDKEIMKLIKELQAKVKTQPKNDRKRLEAAKKDPNARVFSLVITDKNGKKIRRLSQLTYQEAFKQQRDWYKVLVLSMKQRVGLAIEFEQEDVA